MASQSLPETGCNSESVFGQLQIEDISKLGIPFGVNPFTYEQIRKAGFRDENLIKQGKSGDIFIENLEEDQVCVVKRIVNNWEGFSSELKLYEKVNGITGFVPLLGYCVSKNQKEMFLVYKFIPMNLSHCLESTNNTCLESTNNTCLDWKKRLNIAIEVAKALVYLHHECDPPQVHRDIKASSILLDDDFKVWLASLSKACTREIDSFNDFISAYLLRLYMLISPSEVMLACKASEDKELNSKKPIKDVFCFGKLLLELVTGTIGPEISMTDDAFICWLAQNVSGHR